MTAPERILLRAAETGHARCRPDAYLGERFWRYLKATRSVGATFDPKTKDHLLADVATVPALVLALQAEGFAPVLEGDLAERLRARAGEVSDAVARAAASGLRLYPFQQEGVAWLASRDRALLADEMGLGKTIQTLMALPAVPPVVVVAPAAAKGVWKQEAARWRPDLKVSVFSGRGSFRWPWAGELVILNYDILPENLAHPPAPGTVLVADEAHALKNPKALRTKRFRLLADQVAQRGGRTWCLTGTPLLNRPPELWHVLQAAGLARVCFSNWPAFVRHFGGVRQHFGGYEWAGPSAAVPELLRRGMLRRARAAVLPDLPEKTWRTIEVELDPATRATCDEVVARLAELGIDLATADQTMLDTIGGAGFEELSHARHALACAKMTALPALLEEYQEAETPVVVFSAHRPPVDFFEHRVGWATITGDTPAESRTELVAAFQAGQLRGLAATITAAGAGITLTRAAQALFVDLAWTPALNAQAEDRLCRIGQTRGVLITRLVADHALDARVTELLDQKQRLIAASTEAAGVGPGAAPEVAEALRQAAASAAPLEDTAPLGTVPAALGPPAAPSHILLSSTTNSSNATPRRRGAGTDLERWAARGLALLAAADPDRASEENGVGFNQADGEFGPSLAAQVAGSGLTTKQWVAALRLVRKYHRQIGAPPTVEVDHA